MIKNILREKGCKKIMYIFFLLIISSEVFLFYY